MSDEEEWRPVVGWEGLYEVSNLGRVRSLATQGSRRAGKILKQFTTDKGYKRVGLPRPGENRRFLVSRLVCEAFHGAPPKGKGFALHGDGDPANNRPENLRWGNQKENMADSLRHGTHPLAKRTSCPAGHPYDEKNTYVSRLGHRDCRKCHLARVKSRYRAGLSPEDPRHGTNNAYSNLGCRCKECLRARREYIKCRD